MRRGKIRISETQGRRWLGALLRLIPAPLRPERDPVAEALAAAHRNPAAAPEFFKALLSQPLHSFLRDGELVRFSDATGEAFIPLFSRARLLPAAPAGSQATALAGRELLELARGKGRV